MDQSDPVVTTAIGNLMDNITTTAAAAAAAAKTAANMEEDDYIPDPDMNLAITIILGIISVFGTFGNGLVLYVFTRKSDKVTSTIFILALAWTDLFTCMVIVPYTIVSIQTDNHLVYDVACKAYQFLITCNVPLSAFIMVAIAVDRYFSICHPFLHAVTPRRARISILCLCIFAFALGTITALMHGVYVENTEVETVRIGEASWCPNVTGHTAAAHYPTTRAVGGLEFTSFDLLNASTSRPQSLSPDKQVEIFFTDASYSSTGNADIFSTCSRNVTVLEYLNGTCVLDLRLFSNNTVEIYANITASFYAISLLLVFTLYFFIYRSVVRRRAWRRKQKSLSHSPMTVTVQREGNGTKHTKTAKVETVMHAHENMEMLQTKQNGNAQVEGEGEENENALGEEAHGGTEENCNDVTKKHVTVENGNQNHNNPSSKILSSAEKKASRERRDFNFLANIRTAMMLFVVAVVFIISFLPSWLMACRLIDYNIVIFYMYFIYNSANPVIYAFMNQSFRKELKRVFQRGTHFLRSG